MNQTRVTEFLLLGFQNLHGFSNALVFLFLCIYTFTLIVNFFIIFLVAMVPRLKSPMYYFLTQLSLSDILLTTNIVPNMLYVTINGGSKISFAGCITQLFLHGVSATSECLLLTAMSYDRYVAVCKPLHYMTIMNSKFLLLLVLSSWSVACLAMTALASLVCSLPYCGPQVIDHYFCDIAPVLNLSCSDHTVVDRLYFLLAVHFNIIPFTFILFTYICIFIAIYGISTTSGKQKTFSTCSSHLIVVTLYYWTIITIYVIPSNAQSGSFSKVISLLYTTGIPLFNPVIYSLRNRDIKKAILKYILRKKNTETTKES